MGLADPAWGQAVAAVYVPYDPWVLPATLKAAIADRLSRFKHPKHWIPVADLPRNVQGKVNYPQVVAIAQQACTDHRMTKP
ncbi:AMP-binding enzyme [Neosynechococcus sphagnicola]|uniref:AMP-binding enzyme n=1 Tax=Neosynechococcus sphagnicola TaxID=1501145 RepID=UPI001872E134